VDKDFAVLEADGSNLVVDFLRRGGEGEIEGGKKERERLTC